ncbi:hypothetical protein GMLC_38090 [Geomonas limicola]|uniref:Tetratricopeptide repeat protein n=1 Tax=Geomonas limicola TaxID=2740186 RepID=A0A6V8NCS4_9BACT|nr:tetratricopeptide repeat protein [Geomonas limicola]GFO70230.1 hypothetical protein GMLC_38090 [Geomonas limicola]
MASKKDKILESAQRFVLKGQIDKAIKDYQQVVVLDPKEIRHRQRLAELLVRDNRKDEAIVQYEDIARHYAENSYYLKAIAVYKQIQRLVPESTDVALHLAELNAKQGLTGNALAEFGQVATQFEKEGDLKGAVKVLDRMLLVDGVTPATRLKLAELLYSTGDRERAYQEFESYAAQLTKGADRAALARVTERIAELFPERQASPAPVGTPPADAPVREAATGLDLPSTPFEAVAEFPGVPGDTPAPWETPELEPAAPASSAQEPLPWESHGELELDMSDPLEAAPPPVPEIDLPLDFSLSLESDEHNPFAAQAPTEPATAELPSFDDLPSFGTLPEAPAAHGTGEEPEMLELDWPEEIDLSLELEVGNDADAARTAELAAAAEASRAAKAAEQARAAAAEEAEAARLAEEAKAAEEKRLAEEAKAAEAARLAEETRLAEIARAAEAARVAEEARAAEARISSGWQEIFPEALAPGASLDLDELESHYDLGIAYKEMGKLAGAIKEFALAAGNERRRLDCLILQSICYREMGNLDQARELLQRGLALELGDTERTSLRYELAFLLESTGKLEEALELYRQVLQANPAFHEVAERIGALAGEEGLDIIELEPEEEEELVP